ASRIDDGGTQFLAKKLLQRVHVLPRAELKSVVMKTDISHPIRVLAAARVGEADPESGLAIRPADRVIVFVRQLETEECEQATVELFRLLVVADSDGQVIDPDDTHHVGLHSLSSGGTDAPANANARGPCSGSGMNCPPCRRTRAALKTTVPGRVHAGDPWTLLIAHAPSTNTTSAFSIPTSSTDAAPVIAAPSRASILTPPTSRTPVAGTK